MAKSHRRKALPKRRRSQKKRGGYLLEGADLKESLADSTSAKTSLNQGEDFLSYHSAQHGGVADYGQAFDIMSDKNLLASSHSDAQLKALADVRGLHDAQPTPLAPTIAAPGVVNGGPTGSCGTMQGGRRRRRVSRKKGRKSHRKGRKSQKQQKQQKQQGGRRRRYRRQGGGGSHGYAPVDTPGLLLDSAEDYTRAGLNAEYFQSNSTEQLVADKRDNV
jgi:hypothetical protein